MKSLCLFITEAESQRKGQLTRKGEQFANVMAENVMNFLNENLRLDFEVGFDKRVKDLMEDLRWKAMKSQKNLPIAVRSSLEMYEEALFFCGAEKNVQETLKFLGERTALPVVVADELSMDDGLSSFFKNLSEEWLSEGSIPKLLIIGVGSDALKSFFTSQFDAQKSKEMLSHVDSVYETQEGPVVFMSGFEKEGDNLNFYAD